MNVLLSFFDYTGNWSLPYTQDPSFIVERFDIKNGQNILDFNCEQWLNKYIHKYGGCSLPRVALLFAVPCTDYALSGAAWFKRKDFDGTTDKSQELVSKVKEIIDWFEKIFILEFWAIENPMSRIHKLNSWMGKPKLKFNPCDYAGYDPIPENSRYNKQTWLWGTFKNPVKNYIHPLQKEFPGHIKLGGKSERTKELRSITPLGFSYAFYEANKMELK